MVSEKRSATTDLLAQLGEALAIHDYQSAVLEQDQAAIGEVAQRARHCVRWSACEQRDLIHNEVLHNPNHFAFPSPESLAQQQQPPRFAVGRVGAGESIMQSVITSARRANSRMIW